MATNFKPLTLDLIDEGEFLVRANQQLALCQRNLIEHLDEWKDEAKGAKVKLTLEVTIVCEDPKNKHFSLKSACKSSNPALPSSVSLALGGETDDNDEPALFVRTSGSTADSPKQAVLCTKDGRTIDTDTGEVESDRIPNGPISR